MLKRDANRLFQPRKSDGDIQGRAQFAHGPKDCTIVGLQLRGSDGKSFERNQTYVEDDGEGDVAAKTGRQLIDFRVFAMVFENKYTISGSFDE